MVAATVLSADQCYHGIGPSPIDDCHSGAMAGGNVVLLAGFPMPAGLRPGHLQFAFGFEFDGLGGKRELDLFLVEPRQ